MGKVAVWTIAALSVALLVVGCAYEKTEVESPPPAKPTETQAMKVPVAPAKVTVDGDLAEWSQVSFAFKLDSREQVLSEADAWSGPEDASAEVHVASSPENFYVVARVRDSQLVKGEAQNVRSGDSIGIYLSSDPTAWYEGSTRVLVKPATDDRKTEFGWKGEEIEELAQVQIETKPAADGYSLEMAVPVTVLKAILASAEKGALRMAVALYDSDMRGEILLRKTLTIDGKPVDLYETDNYQRLTLK